MIDHGAVQKAIYDALNVPAVTDIAPVFQHVPNDQEPPVVIIADLTATGAGSKDRALDRIEFEILTLIRAPSRLGLYALQAAQRGQLEGQQLTAAGADLSRPVLDSSEDDLLEDGKTYFGRQRYSLFAQEAD